MIPNLQNVDHIHLNVSDRSKSEEWYRLVLGFQRVETLEFWAVSGGPLTLESANKNIHLALFENAEIQDTTIAFKVGASELDEWIIHLAENDIHCKPVDHAVSWSIYFKDPDGNPFEITTYEYDVFIKNSKTSS
ncbi:VOC family protein [Endozoicomonas sp.]|uniref:VOC family protein n=1 Tax=Endozoicomonas sp. TaxID=1892382 RepID=UPI003AF50438